MGAGTGAEGCPSCPNPGRWRHQRRLVRGTGRPQAVVGHHVPTRGRGMLGDRYSQRLGGIRTFLCCPHRRPGNRDFFFETVPFGARPLPGPAQECFRDRRGECGFLRGHRCSRTSCNVGLLRPRWSVHCTAPGIAPRPGSGGPAWCVSPLIRDHPFRLSCRKLSWWSRAVAGNWPLSEV